MEGLRASNSKNSIFGEGRGFRLEVEVELIKVSHLSFARWSMPGLRSRAKIFLIRRLNRAPFSGNGILSSWGESSLMVFRPVPQPSSVMAISG